MRELRIPAQIPDICVYKGFCPNENKGYNKKGDHESILILHERNDPYFVGVIETVPAIIARDSIPATASSMDL